MCTICKEKNIKAISYYHDESALLYERQESEMGPSKWVWYVQHYYIQVRLDSILCNYIHQV